MNRENARASAVLLGLIGVIAAISTPTIDASTASQSAQTARAEFEVVSVRPRSDTAVLGKIFATGISELPGGRFRAQAVTLLDLIRHAYPSLRPRQILGGPAWIRSDRFDVEAVAEPTASAEQRQAMLRHMLTDRFRLQAGFERRPLEVYALVIERADGRLGPNLSPSRLDCDAPPSPELPLGSPCGLSAEPGLIEARGTPLSGLVGELSYRAGRMVVDETGLSGNFDFELKWTPVTGPPRSAEESPGAATPTAAPPGSVSLFTAVGEQLGLKMESKQAPVEVLVIRSAERPEPN